MLAIVLRPRPRGNPERWTNTFMMIVWQSPEFNQMRQMPKFFSFHTLCLPWVQTLAHTVRANEYEQTQRWCLTARHSLYIVVNEKDFFGTFSMIDTVWEM